MFTHRVFPLRGRRGVLWPGERVLQPAITTDSLARVMKIQEIVKIGKGDVAQEE
jgi:hypothetical protein